MTKFEPKFIDVTCNPTIIIGEKPNTTRNNSTTSLVGNRTGDFVEEAISDSKNIILTNVTNALYSGPFDPAHEMMGDSILELIDLFEEYMPKKIICLGNIARDYVSSIWKPENCQVIELPHPSWVNRFHHKDRHLYIQALKDAINK